jgi:hypothetical protein
MVTSPVMIAVGATDAVESIRAMLRRYDTRFPISVPRFSGGPGRGAPTAALGGRGDWVALCCILGEVSGVEVHRDVVDRALTALGCGWDAWPDVAADPRLDPQTRLSALLVLLEEAEDLHAPDVCTVVVGDEDGHLDWQGRPRQPWESLSRARLPWTAATATAALGSVTRSQSYDHRRVALVLRGAGEVCAAGHADAALLDALDECLTRLERETDEQWRIKEMRGLARRVVASATPADLLDLSLLVDGDAWGAPAREAARALPADGIAPLVRLLGDLGPRRPPQGWLREVERALEVTPARQLLRRWVELAAGTDIVPQSPGTSVEHVPGTLFVGTNADVVRAVVWATSVLPDAEWPAEQLGALARRGAAHNGLPGLPEALSLKVASAAVDVLVLRGGQRDRRVLAELLEDLQRRDLVKRIGAALDRPDAAAQREEELRRTKAQAVRRRASPAPRKARAAMDSLIRQHFGADLRTLGFSGGPRTWRRAHPDRVDVIAIGSTAHFDTGENRLHLCYGTRFDAVHPDDEPHPVDRNKLRDYDLDFRIFDHDHFTDAPFGEDYLAAVAARLRDVVVPLLNRLGDYATVTALLEADTGLPPGAWLEGNLGSPARSEVLGMLALAAGDRATAVKHLTRTLQSAQSWATIHPDTADSDNTVLAYWAGMLDRARRLP